MLKKKKIVLHLRPIKHIDSQIKWKNILKADYMYILKHHIIWNIKHERGFWSIMNVDFKANIILIQTFYLTLFIHTTKCTSVGVSSKILGLFYFLLEYDCFPVFC